jgi:hypothetical protein
LCAPPPPSFSTFDQSAGCSYEPTEEVLDRATVGSQNDHFRFDSSGGREFAGASAWDSLEDDSGSPGIRRLEAAALSAQLRELLTPKEYAVLALRFRLTLAAPAHPPPEPLSDEGLASDLMISGRLRSFGEMARLLGQTEAQSKYQVNSSIRKLRRVCDVLRPFLGEI